MKFGQLCQQDHNSSTNFFSREAQFGNQRRHNRAPLQNHYDPHSLTGALRSLRLIVTKFKVALSILSKRRALHVLHPEIKVSALFSFLDDVQQFWYKTRHVRVGVSALNPDIWQALPHVPIPSQKHAEGLNGHPACDNKGAQRKTQSRPQTADNEQTSTRCVRTEDLGIKEVLNKIDL